MGTTKRLAKEKKHCHGRSHDVQEVIRKPHLCSVEVVFPLETQNLLKFASQIDQGVLLCFHFIQFS